MGLKVCMYAIAKDESQNVNRWVRAHREADLMIVTDTGSSDDTVNKLRSKGVIVYEEKIEPFRFDLARNISLSHVPKDTDICVCTDMDEAFEPGWRKKIEKAWKNGVNRVYYLFNFSLLSDGSPGLQMNYSKIHSREGFVWYWPIHEWLKYVGDDKEKKVFVKDVVLNHYQDCTKSRKFYLDILEFAVKEMPDDSRMRYYLGREYMYNQRWKECINTLEEYLSFKVGPWTEEKSAAMRWIANSYLQLGNKDECYKYYIRAMDEMPQIRDPLKELATAAIKFEDWTTVILALKLAFKISKRIPAMESFASAWDQGLYEIISEAYNKLGIES